MKKITLFLLALVSSSMILQAQQSARPHHDKPKSTEERVNHEVKRVTEKLQLTPQQQQLWAAAATQRIQRIEPLKPAKTQPQVQSPQQEMSRDQKKAKHEAIQKERIAFDQQVKSFLTPEQLAKYEVIKQDRKEKHEQHREERKNQK